MMLVALLVDILKESSCVFVSMRTSSATCNVKRPWMETIRVGLARLEKSWHKKTGESFEILGIFDDQDNEICLSTDNRNWKRASRAETTKGTIPVFVNPSRLESVECYGTPTVGIPSYAAASASNGGIVDLRWLADDRVVGNGSVCVPSRPCRSLRLEASLSSSGHNQELLRSEELRRFVDMGAVVAPRTPKVAWDRVESFAKKESCLRVGTYNLLAGAYGDRFGATPNVLRAPIALHEITKLDADILCLQEVDEQLFDKFWRPHLALLGYEGDFAKKSGPSREGLATFFKKAKFSRREKQIIPLIVEDDPDFEKVNTVALATVLEPKRRQRPPTVVANTHLYFANRATALRLTQMRLLLRGIDGLGSSERIIAGDLNAFPDSDAIRLCLENGFNSAYDMTRPTHHVQGFTATLDYILWSSQAGSGERPQSLSLDRNLPLPEVRVGLTPAMPNNDFPSDHFLLAADFSSRG